MRYSEAVPEHVDRIVDTRTAVIGEHGIGHLRGELDPHDGLERRPVRLLEGDVQREALPALPGPHR